MSERFPIIGLIFHDFLAETSHVEIRSQAGRSLAERAQSVFDETRLTARRDLFEAFTLPSLGAQTDPDFRIVVITSSLLPEPFRARLDAQAQRWPWLSVRYFPPSTGFNEAARLALAEAVQAEGPAGRVVHFRLDDDDALACDFVARLRAAARGQAAGQIISLVNGWYVTTGGPDAALAVASLAYPKVSLGLAMVTDGPVERTIHDMGNHWEIAENLVACVGGEGAWLRSIHNAAESQVLRDPFELHTLPENRHLGLDAAGFRAILAEKFPRLDPARLRAALTGAAPVNRAAMRAAPGLGLTQEEGWMLKRCYAGAEVILEYGCGGTTVLGARMPGKLILSVESDGERARATDTYLDFADLPSAASIHRVDLAGGDGQMRYARGIWDEPFFRHPDLVLINGRFRSACLAAVCTGIRRRVSVLISDHERLAAFLQRPDLLCPVKQVGRLALFDVQPGMFDGAALAAVLDAAGEELTV